jgi:hypothetical protein
MNQRRPLHGKTREALPRAKRLLEAYEFGIPVTSLARQEGVTRQNIYVILKLARQYRERGLISGVVA